MSFKSFNFTVQKTLIENRQQPVDYKYNSQMKHS